MTDREMLDGIALLAGHFFDEGTAVFESICDRYPPGENPPGDPRERRLSAEEWALWHQEDYLRRFEDPDLADAMLMLSYALNVTAYLVGELHCHQEGESVGLKTDFYEI